MEELNNDLSALVRWGNLRAQQESGKVKIVENWIRRLILEDSFDEEVKLLAKVLPHSK